MSERQEDIRARQEAQALAMRQQLWAGVDPSVIERWAGMVPAGFQFGDSAANNAAMNWAPGRVMTPEEVQQVVGNVANYTLGSEGMDLARYLADPRAAIKVEGGQYVYRPEALRPEDDFQGIPKTGFWNNANLVSMLPLAAFAAGPFAASLGAAGGAAAAGGAEAAGAGAAGEFGASFAPTITPSTVAQSGLLYSGGSMPTVAGLSGVGGLTAEGAAALAAMGSAGAGLGAGTTGALGSLGLDAAGNIVSQGVNLANSATTAAGLGSTVTGGASGTGALTQGASSASSLAKLLSGEASLDDYLKLGGTALSGLLGAKASSDQTDAFTELSNKYLNLGAPARARLEQSYADPMSFLNGPDVQSITQQGSDAAARSLSTQYGNPALAPNAWAKLNEINTGNQWSQLANYRNQLAAQGGLGIAPASQFDANSAASSGQGYNIAGALIGDLTSPKKSMLEQMKELAGLYNQQSIFGGSVMGV